MAFISGFLLRFCCSELAAAIGSTSDDVAEALLQIDARNVDLLSDDKGL